MLSEKKTPSICKIQLVHLQPEWEPCAPAYSLVRHTDFGSQAGTKATTFGGAQSGSHQKIKPLMLPQPPSATFCHLYVCPQASDTLCLSIPSQFITKFLKYYIFYYIQIHFIAFDNTDNHIPYALMFRTQCMLTAVFIHDA